MWAQAKVPTKHIVRDLAGHVTMPGPRVLAGTAAVLGVQEVVGQASSNGLRPQEQKM